MVIILMESCLQFDETPQFFSDMREEFIGQEFDLGSCGDCSILS